MNMKRKNPTAKVERKQKKKRSQGRVVNQEGKKEVTTVAKEIGKADRRWKSYNESRKRKNPRYWWKSFKPSELFLSRRVVSHVQQKLSRKEERSRSVCRKNVWCRIYRETIAE
uniref:Uncharacterized protein n=1 Tax=Cacopsylla melanoneura TaxID=428564 RepID=A0A8D9BNH6_9HEMI